MKLILRMEEQDDYYDCEEVLNEIKTKIKADYDEITEYMIIAKD